MIENEKKNVVIVKKNCFADGTFGYKLSNGLVHVGKYSYLKKLLKDRYGISI